MAVELETDDPTPGVSRLCRYLSERSPLAMIAVAGTSHVVSYLNPAFARLVGEEREELIGRPFVEAVPEGDGNGCITLLDRVYLPLSLLTIASSLFEDSGGRGVRASGRFRR